jgi:hypothetical protein
VGAFFNFRKNYAKEVILKGYPVLKMRVELLQKEGVLMKNKILAFAIILSILFCQAVLPVNAEDEIEIGDYVTLGRYYGQPILWRCVDIDENGPLMLSDRILCLKMFDNEGSNTSASHGRGHNYTWHMSREINGSNYWADSNIRDWLNSTASAGNVVWTCGNPPTGGNSYGYEAGFLSNFSLYELPLIKTVTQKSLLDREEYNDMSSYGEDYASYDFDIGNVVGSYELAYSEQVTDRMFLLDVKQINTVYDNRNVLGNDYYVGIPTQEAVDNSDYNEGINSNEGWYYYLRSPYVKRNEDSSSVSTLVYTINQNGTLSGDMARDWLCGIRPAFYLDTLALNFMGGEGTAEAPYIIDSVPTSVTIAETQCTENSIKLISYAYINAADTPAAFGTLFIPIWLFSDSSATPARVEYSVSEYPIVSGDTFGTVLSNIPDGYDDVYFVGKSYITLDDDSIVWSKAKKVKLEEGVLRRTE